MISLIESAHLHTGSQEKINGSHVDLDFSNMTCQEEREVLQSLMQNDQIRRDKDGLLFWKATKKYLDYPDDSVPYWLLPNEEEYDTCAIDY